MSLSVLAFLVSFGTVAGLVKLTTSAIEGDESENVESDSSLTVDVSSTELTIELADQPVFAVLPVDITVEEATTLGYTLTAYAEDTNLVSTTDSSKVIPMVTIDTTGTEEADEAEELRSLESDAVESSDSSSLVSLSPNTYGLSFTDPESVADEVYTSLSTDSTTPTFITDKDYLATEANDTTTIYYGFYITPDTPYGTYTGSNITVDAIPNIATVTYNANGLYYNDSEEDTINTVGYKPNVAEAPIEEVVGQYLTPAPLTPVDPSTTIHYTFLGWSEDRDATTPTYTNEEDILANLTLTKNESLTLYAVWHYNTVLSFNGTTSDGGEAIAEQTIAAGDTITLPQNTYTRTGSVFTGWNTVETPTPENPGTEYEDQSTFTAPNESADITLYAQWAYTTTITFNGNGETSGTMSPQTVVAGTPQNLTPNAFVRTNATFIGWNTSPDGTSTSYADQAEFIADATQHEDITLYAQWAATTISFNGNTSESGTMNPITIAGGTSTTLPQNTYTKSHCSFTSWNTNPDGTGTRYPGEASYTASMDGIYSFTLYAQWQCESMINFNGNGADSGYMPGIMATGGQQTTLPQNTFVRDGYSFNGWNTSEDGTGESYPDQGTCIAPVSESQDITLYAQWAATTITFSGNGATSGSMDQFNIPAGTTANLPQNTFTRTGYVFNGWNTSPDGTGTSYSDQSSYYATAGVNTSVTLHAQWLPTTTITFNGNGADGGTMNSITAIGGESTTLPQNEYTKTNATFIGWNTQANGTGTPYSDQSEFVASTTQHDDITLYAQWASTTITFNGNGADGGSMSTATIAAGTSANLPQNAFTRTGYAFAGWNTVQTPTAENPGTSYSNEAEYSAVAGVNASVTLYAQWAYYTTITFNGNGADTGSMSDQVIVAGTPQNLTPNVYAKDGYVFANWNTVENPTTENPGTVYADKAPYTASTTQPESFTLYAQWREPTLYDRVAAMSKGTQDVAALQADITAPTTGDPATDTSNSGVYEYNATVFGEASDASSTNKIYYYRGILEQTADQGSYGSDGKATTYPNYVRLGNNTCWRIVRTTGSGGVKMVYNGTWTGSTCANITTNAQLTTSPFNTNSATVAGKAYTGLQYQNMHAIGYTYSNVAPRTTSRTTLGTLLGATGDDTTTNTNSSIIKQYIEDWYSTNMANSTNNYTSILEESAGYCNDRSVYNRNSHAASTVLPDSVEVVPYGTSGMTVYKYGAFTRNYGTAQNPSLTCPRGIVDTYSTTTTSGGNGQLAQPTALLTADELSFAGSGDYFASNGSSYNAKSYLNSGNVFWLLSPYHRGSGGVASESYLSSSGSLSYYDVSYPYGVRPAISLKPGTTVADGDGTATNPWTIGE